MNIKTLLLNIAPFFLAKKWYRHVDKRLNVISYNSSLPDIEDQKSKFKNIVSVQGLGYSGSGAVVDLLREYSSCLTFGGIDDSEGSKSRGIHLDSGEIDFLRFSGGLFEIEKYLNDNNLFIKDALIKRLKCTLDHCALFRYKEPRYYANQFYNQLIDFEIDTRGQTQINWQVTDRLRNDCNIKIMRDLSKEKYYSLCLRFLTHLFNYFYQDQCQYLCLDQLCSDGNFDINHYNHYIPSLKVLVVFRDPRDVYCFAVKKNILWIAHDDVYQFVKWYKLQTRNIDLYSKEYLVIRFEDLVYDYANQVGRIEDFLGMSSSQHLSVKSCFDPRNSQKNIGLWKGNIDKRADYEYIYQELTRFCYEKRG